MSTTDSRAAFEVWFYENHKYTPRRISAMNGHYHSHAARVSWDAWSGALQWQAATEAAKATGTAGEHSHQGNRYGNLTDAEYIEMTRQEAARQPAPVAIKTWQERAEPDRAYWGQGDERPYMRAEIEELRAALAVRSQP